LLAILNFIIRLQELAFRPILLEKGGRTVKDILSVADRFASKKPNSVAVIVRARSGHSDVQFIIRPNDIVN
jgi:hypothetical protein